MIIKLDSPSKPNSSLALNATAVQGFNIQGAFSAVDFPSTPIHWQRNGASSSVQEQMLTPPVWSPVLALGPKGLQRMRLLKVDCLSKHKHGMSPYNSGLSQRPQLLYLHLSR